MKSGSCLVVTNKIKDLAEKSGESIEAVKGLISVWQKKNNKSIEDYPTLQEFNEFKIKQRSNNNQPIIPVKTGQMTFKYGNNKRNDIKASTTIEAIINGERTATTRYSTDNHIEYWKDIKVGDIVAFTSEDKKTIVYVRITSPLIQLNSLTNAEEWSKKEGWSIDYYNKKVKPKVEKGQAYQMEYEFVDIVTENNQQKNTKKNNGYEVSTKGDKRFSALVATFKEGTIIEGIDVGGKTIEYVYQNIIKKSGKGKAPSVDSILNLDRVEEDGEPSWLKEGLDNKLPKDLWLKLYGIYGGNFEAIGEPVPEITIEDKEDFSYYVGYLPLWQEWARQNPELIEELKEKSRGKTLTDQFANTRVSQARALAQILNESSRASETVQMLDEALSSSFDTPKISSIETQAKVDLLFDPKIRRDRVTLISRLFSNEIDDALQEYKDSINKRLKELEGSIEEDIIYEDLEKNKSIYSKLKTETNASKRNMLRAELNAIDRWDVVNKYTPGGIFRRVLENTFESYINDTEDNRIQAELYIINKTKGANKYSDKQKLDAAKKRAAYKYAEYKKIAENKEVFQALAEEASTIILFTEGIRVDPNYIQTAPANLNDDTPEGDSELDEQSEDWKQEEAYKDGWMTNFRQVSSYESLSQEVRKVINKIPKLDYKGKPEKDDLGFARYLDANYVHATLIDKLKDMINSEDMIPLMQELEKNKPWIKKIIKLLQNDNTLFSQFYQDFRKDFISYWIQKKKMMPDGTFKIQTVSINKPEGVYYLIDSWRDNYEYGNQLDDDSVYEKNGEINIKNAEKGLKKVEKLINDFSNLDTEARFALLEDEKVWNTILKLLNMIGIDANPFILKNALTDIKTAEGITFTDPIMLLLPQLDIIFSGIKKGNIKSEKKEDGSEKRGDLINTFGSAYNTIANMIASVTEDAIESSVRENDKSYYSHTTPAYLGKLIKQFKNVRGDMKKFEEFINTEFKQYEWFYKDEEWRSDWLEQLVKSEEMRKGLDHKVVLNFDKKEYSKWNELDHTLALLTEYWGDPEDTRKSVKWAWYPVPNLSDAPSAEFIRFRKYVSGVEYDKNGNKLTYEDIILNKLINLVNQEYDRIMLVRARDEELQKNNPNISPIENYDIVRDDNGNIKNIGGAEFKFLPALNSIKYDNGETFINRLYRLSKESSGTDLKEFIKNTLREVMDNGFEEAYRDWVKIGLFDELPNGRYKYLSNKIQEGQSKQNARTAKFLINAKKILGTTLWTTEMELLLKDYNNNNPIYDKVAEKLFQQIKDLLNQKVAKGNVTKQEVDNIKRNLIVKNNAKEALREYYWNSKLATSQIIELTTTDLAFYKNIEDFVKRYKEIHAPSLRMNTKAIYKGKRIGRDWERTIYLEDDEITSSILNNVETVIMEKYKKGELSDYNAASILSKFGYSNHIIKDKNGKTKKYAKVGNTMVETSYVNVADAQAYRSLSSYRAILGMSGQWTDEMEQAYNNFKEGNWNINDFNIIWQTKKPFVYTQINNISGIKGHTGIKTPVQHKNSEFLLLAMYELVAGPLGKSGKLKAINDFMEENYIDVAQFESTTKVGKQGKINLNTKLNMTSKEKALLDSKLKREKITQNQYNEIIEKNTVPITSYEDTMTVLKEATGISSGKENPNVVHKVSYEDYGIQTATPEHAIDAVQLVGTQIRKLITADIAPDAIIEVNGEKKTKQEWIDLYNAINTENIIQAFIEVDEIFKDPKKIEEILLEEIRSSQRYGIEMTRACTLDENGQFNIPLFDPVQSQKVQSLLNSIIKNRVTKQKIRGGALIQVSNYGLTDDLHIVFEGEGENKRIKYFECYMPAYSREFYEPLMDPITHQLDVTKLPEDLRKLIGYRVPTEDKYSMVPLYIKGFLPQQNGSAIMLPAEITTLSGSDFDVDKLYIMLPEFRIVDKYRIKDAWGDFYNEPFNADIVEEIDRNIGIAFEDYQRKHPEDELNIDDYIKFLQNQDIRKYQFSKTAQDRFKKWFESRKKQYSYGIKEIVKIKYDSNKTPQENSLEARNNLLIDLMWGVLTNADTASKILNPGGFDYQKKAARIVSILYSSYESDLRKDLNIPNSPIITKLLSMDLDSLNKLADKAKKKLDPLSPRTQVYIHQQNMTGAKLIGIYANHNANHALMQHVKELGLDIKNGSFKLNGKSLTSLHDITNKDKEFISKNNAGFLAASVDNVKDPILATINQNTFTADATMLLSRLGYNPIEIGLLLTQPIIIDITQTYFRESIEGKDKDTIINKVIENYQKKAAMMENITYDDYKNNDFLIEDLADNIIIAKKMEGIISANQTSDFNKVEFYKKQVAVGFLFKRIMNSANALGQLVQATRADTQNGAAGPTIADTKLKIQKVQNFLRDMEENDKFPLVGADIISDTISFNGNIDELREQLLKSKLPFLQAFYTLGLKQTEKMLGKYFPQFTEPFNEVIDTIRKMTKTGKLDVKTMNNIYNDLLAYIMSKTEFFGSDTDYGTSADKRSHFINNFPIYFKEVIENNKDIAELEFIKRLKVVRANDNNPVDIVVFKNVGQLSPILRERYMRDWAYLLYMKNPKAQEFALNLFRYSYYRNGFAFGPSTFIHLAPIIIRKVIPDYIETLRSLTTSEDDYSNFIEQYIYNHLDNRKLVPEVPEEASTLFIGEDDEIKNEVTFIIDKSSNFGDKKIIKKIRNTPNGTEYDFFDFIAKRIRGNYVYYKLTTNKSNKSNIAIYERIKPLGAKNNFIEYEYGKEVSKMTSVITKKVNKNYNPKANNEIFAASETPQMTEEDSSYYGNYEESLTRDSLKEAYVGVYNTSLETSQESQNDITSYSPNVNYPDENNEQICGAELLK